MSLYVPIADIRLAGVAGAGSVGASWIALLLANDLEVVAYDPAPGSEARARAFVSDAWPALRSLGIARTDAPPGERLRFVASATEMARAADFIQENVFEKPSVKEAVLREIDAAAAAHKIIASSTGGIPPSALQAACSVPERFVVVHPFNPAHLMPLVEVVGGRRTGAEAVAWAMAFCRRLGKHPIELKREAAGHMTNRLQFALVREAVHCLEEGLASAEDIDAAVRYGLGPRWALMGSLLTLHLAGGPGGMQGILDHTGEAIDGWWQDLGAPRMTPQTRSRLVQAGAEVSQGRSIAQWTQWRDAMLVRLLSLTQDEAPQGAPRVDRG